MTTVQEFLTLDPNVALAKVEKAIATGATSITYNGNTFRFRSLEDLERIKGRLTRQIQGAAARKPLVRVVYSKHG